VGCRLNQGIEHGLKLEFGAADDLEHLSGRRLLFERFTELAAARLHLVEQAHVLDGDHRLVGEHLKEFDLPIREERDLGSGDGDRPERDPVAQQRDRQGGRKFLAEDAELEFRIFSAIAHMNEGARQDGLGGDAFAPGADRKHASSASMGATRQVRASQPVVADAYAPRMYCGGWSVNG
jgi:hypothetical protein